MRKVKCGRGALDLLCMLPRRGCACLTYISDQDENKPLIIPPTVKDVTAPPRTLAFHLKPKVVVLRVSMHCNGCARKVEKHISKLEGVSSYQVDLETKMVVVRGDIVPFQVLESVSKVKYAELWEQ